MFVMMGMGMGQTAALLGAEGVVSEPPAPITAIAADGWRATYPSPPALTPLSSPETVSVTRQGFTPGGLATSVVETLTLMARLRQPYPNQATLSPDQVALSDFIYAADSISGVINGSNLAYPQPIACWLTPDLERARGTTFTARLAVAHAYARLGKPVAAVKFIASDGTNTVEHLVSTMSQRQFASGLHAPYFEASISLSILNPAALCTLDVIIYPWVGAAFQASVHMSMPRRVIMRQRWSPRLQPQRPPSPMPALLLRPMPSGSLITPPMAGMMRGEARFGWLRANMCIPATRPQPRG